MSFIFFLLLLFLFFALFVLTSVLRFFGSIFGIGRKRHEGQVNQDENSGKSTRKVFSKDEGEYVDFEEIDDDENNRTV